MVKIKVYKIAKKGLRGLSVSLPRVWTDDLGLSPGDRLNMYRDDKGRLIIVAGEGA